jgi:hypothetical protein
MIDWFDASGLPRRGIPSKVLFELANLFVRRWEEIALQTLTTVAHQHLGFVVNAMNQSFSDDDWRLRSDVEYIPRPDQCEGVTVV